MGRQLRRVALDFDWPLNKVWSGFLCPIPVPRCRPCEGTGSSLAARLFSAQWYGHVDFDPALYGATALTLEHPAIQAFAKRNVERAPGFCGGHDAVSTEAQRLFFLFRGQWCHQLIQADVDALVAAGRLMDFTHRPRNEEQCEVLRTQAAAGGSNWWLKEPNGYTPTADEVNAWSLQGMGHDSINSWVCVEARCKREGVPKRCGTCRGSGEAWPSKEAKAEYTAWKATDPPGGDGYQLWETVSEGAPITPVFATPEELARHLADGGGWKTDRGTSYEQWMCFIAGPGWAPSLVMDGAGVRSGVNAVAACDRCLSPMVAVSAEARR